MLAAAMDAVLSPLYRPDRLKFVPLTTAIGAYLVPCDFRFPVDAALFEPEADDYVEGAIYVLCYHPLHEHAAAYRSLVSAYVEACEPAMPARLMGEAQQAVADGDWVGAVGRLWTVVQLEPGEPEPLAKLAVTCLRFGLGASPKGYLAQAIALAKASAAALNTLEERFPAFAPAHFYRAEFLLAAGQPEGAIAALQEALRLGLDDERLSSDATLLMQELLARETF